MGWARFAIDGEGTYVWLESALGPLYGSGTGYDVSEVDGQIQLELSPRSSGWIS